MPNVYTQLKEDAEREQNKLKSEISKLDNRVIELESNLLIARDRLYDMGGKEKDFINAIDTILNKEI